MGNCFGFYNFENCNLFGTCNFEFKISFLKGR